MTAEDSGTILPGHDLLDRLTSEPTPEVVCVREEEDSSARLITDSSSLISIEARAKSSADSVAPGGDTTSRMTTKELA
jgi:hypothetical protein